MSELTHTLPITLQRARKSRRLSQLELSMRVGVSQRHVSFVENGRAKPSRELLMAWLHELETPLAVRNAALLQAGYAPVYGAARLTDPALAQVSEALAELLRAHEPTPALVMDAQWNVLQMNRGGKWLAVTLMPWVEDLPDDTPINLLDMLIHPDGFTKMMINLSEVGPTHLSYLRAEASVQPALTPKVEAFAAMLSARIGSRNLHASPLRATMPLLTPRYATRFGELAFFSMFTTFGSPQDITLASLRVEHMFPADEETRTVLRAQIG